MHLIGHISLWSNLSLNDLFDISYISYIFGRQVIFQTFCKTPAQSCPSQLNWIPLKGTHRPIRPIYFWSLGFNCRRRGQGHTWGLPAGVTCRIFLKWKVQGECRYLKWKLHGEFTHLIHIVMLRCCMLPIHPTIRHLTNCAIATADVE